MTTPPPGVEEQFTQAKTLTLNLLDTRETVTEEQIRAAVRGARAALNAMGRSIDIDEERLVRDVEAMVNVFVGRGASLEDNTDHVEWLSQRRAEINWGFWDRYRTYLRDVVRLPPASIGRMDEMTDDVLRRLEDPQRPGPWDRRGLVVGRVQSGKTGNYTGLICKAADAGYKLIVVLAGVHNSLRSQTQLRLDEGFLGFDTQQQRFFDQTNRRIGVGALTGSAQLLKVSSLTNSEERGDFNLAVARQVGMIGSDPVLLVVKKNKSILENLIRWATSLHQQRHPETGRMVVPNVPILVIDDEADHASVNTRDVPLDENGRPDDDVNPTRINQLIRELLHTFEQSAYVGYTATPFANIFIYADQPSLRYGEDLFPRSFIINLPTPSNHVGPADVFGLREDLGAGITARAAMPIVRDVDDADPWLAPQHKKDTIPGGLPASLREAIRAFVITCAARAARGQEGVHNSMLVHVTRFVNVQERVTEQIAEELRQLRDRLRYGDGAAPDQLTNELRTMWETDFEPTGRAFEQADLTPLAWDDVVPHMPAAAGRIEVMRINGTAKDALTYYDHRDGLSVIAVGGDKLSRGLTLEGLSISYFLRASRMYDTLMQMGRWFGYRPGYLDLCRLYTTRELSDWYRDITAANEELLTLFDEMAEMGETPENFGLRVRTHPDGLLITARAKMRHALMMKLSFSNTIIETIAFDRDEDTQRHNLELVDGFLRNQSDQGHGDDERPRGNWIWKGVSGADVADMLADFRTHERALKARGDLLAKYIRSRLADDQLTEWTVALISRTSGGSEQRIGDRVVGLTQRSALAQASDASVYRIRRLGSPTDEFLDLTADQQAAALALTKRIWEAGAGDRPEPEIPSGPAIRRHRAPSRGLLLLYPLDPSQTGDDDPAPFPQGFTPIVGFAVSFPDIKNAPAIDYAVTNVYWQQMELGQV